MEAPTPDAPRIDQVGPYHVLDTLGEGGFGVVYLAEQREPVRRRVAIKVIKPGMDSKEVLARFEAERQALALLDHPGIAKVFDAGATAGGQPYFAMEHVPGVSLVEFCDAQRMPTKGRIQLFISVCQAVQHAHQKGIIHRDLKPSNILVMLVDGRPVPKVIDFGIAKATSQQLTERTLYTQTGQMVGTPEYMSPEQAGTSGLDVDTRTDVYSLGVLLYELLVGTLPFEPSRLREAGFLEIVRLIKEEEPPRPSTRLQSTDTETVARNRRVDTRTLVRELRGDLDWIVVKAIEKDRGRRYETASALAMDLQRFLEHEPVVARPPSTGYRIRRFVRKHRVGVFAGGVVVTALLAGAVAATWGWLEAERQRDEARGQRDIAVRLGEQLEAARRDAETERDAAKAERDAAERARASAESVTRFMTGILGLANPDVSKDPDTTARAILDQAAATVGRSFRDQPAAEVQVRTVIGEAYMALGQSDAAIEHLRRALSLLQGTPGAWPHAMYRVLRPYRLAAMTRGMITLNLNRRLQLAALDVLGEREPELAEAARAMCREHFRPGGTVEFERVLALADTRFAAGDPRWQALGDLFLTCGQAAYPQGNLWYERALQVYTARCGCTPTDTRVVSCRLLLIGRLSAARGLYAKRVQTIRETMASVDGFLHEDHWYRGSLAMELGYALTHWRKFAEAKPWLEAARRSTGLAAATWGLVTQVQWHDLQGRSEEIVGLRRQLAERVARRPSPADLEWVESVLGKTHESLTAGLRKLTGIRPQAAESTIDEVLQLCREQLVKGEADTAVVAKFLVGQVDRLSARATRAVMIRVLEYAHEMLGTSEEYASSHAAWWLAELHRRVGNFERAEQAATQGLAAAQREGDAIAIAQIQSILGPCRFELGRTKEGERLAFAGYRDLAAALGEDERFTNGAFLAWTILQRRDGKRAAAIESCRDRLARLAVGEAAPYAMASTIWALTRNLGSDADAKLGAREMIRRFPEDHRPHLELARLAALRYDRDAALQHSARSLELAPTNANVLNTIAEIHCRLGLLEEADRAAQRATELAPTPAWRNNHAEWLARLGQGDRAHAMHEATATDHPDYAYAHLNLASGWLRRGDRDRALASARKAFELAPAIGGPQLARTLLALDLDATGHFATASRRAGRPNGDGFWRDYGVAMARAGRVAEARDRLARLTEEWPTEPHAFSARAWFLVTAQGTSASDHQHGLELARQAVDLCQRRGPVMLATLAEAQFRNGQREAAIATARETLQLLSGKPAEWVSVDDIQSRLEHYRTDR